MACTNASAAGDARDVEGLLSDNDSEVMAARSNAFPKRVATALILLGVVAPAAVIVGSRTEWFSQFVQQTSAVPASERDARGLWNNYNNNYNNNGYNSNYYNGGQASGNQWNGDNGGQWNGNNGYSFVQEGHVPCDGESCTCEWSTASYCSVKDQPRTECWGCCCSRLFPQEYQRAMAAYGGGGYGGGGYGGGRGQAFFQTGALVRVLGDRGFWKQAKIIRYVGNQHYEVRMLATRRTKVVAEERIALDSHPRNEWLYWVLWDCCILGFCICLACGCGALIMKNSRNSGAKE